jgi:hypothetical protein
VNLPPVLQPLGTRLGAPYETLTFAVAATDPDLPANPLTYRLINAPSGASIGASSGVFSWTPAGVHANRTFMFEVEVSDGSVAMTAPLAIEVGASAVAGFSVLWVSDYGPEGISTTGVIGAADDGFVTLLRDAGYRVTRFNPGDGLSEALVPEVNAYDLVIIGRSATSSRYANPYGQRWNTRVQAPVLALSPFVVQTTGERFGWFAGSTIIDGTPARLLRFGDAWEVDHLFKGIELDGAATAANYDEALDRNTSHISSPPVVGGVPLATASIAGQTVPVVVAFPQGTKVRNDNDTLAGYRLYFAAGSRELAGSTQFGKENLTLTGERIFLNAVSLAVHRGELPPPDVPVSAADSWLAERFSAATPEDRRGLLDDANGDGISNLMAYAIGSHPEEIGQAALPAVSDDPEGLSLIVRLRGDDPALRFSLKSSGDLTAWSDHHLSINAQRQWSITGPGVEIASATALGGGVWELQLAIEADSASGFWSLHVEHNQ